LKSGDIIQRWTDRKLATIKYTLQYSGKLVTILEEAYKPWADYNYCPIVSPDESKFVSNYNGKGVLVDLGTLKVDTLKDNFRDYEWSPDSSKIVVGNSWAMEFKDQYIGVIDAATGGFMKLADGPASIVHQDDGTIRDSVTFSSDMKSVSILVRPSENDVFAECGIGDSCLESFTLP
jgi:Tol biopolymer transport system component